MSNQTKSAPPDQAQRDRALDPSRSILVQAPAGSGKTTLLAERFLRLLAEVDQPGQVVAITFTNAAAAEMRNRILDELRKEQPSPLARRALDHSHSLGWNLLDLPAQLRISTIDSFCRELAIQQPLLSGLGGAMDIAEQPKELYRRAARSTLKKIDQPNSSLSAAIEALLLWRDNGWQEMEDLLVEMLAQRDRWMHDFLLEREPDWDQLRERLERPFARAIQHALDEICQLFDQAPGALDEALELARFACEEPGANSPHDLAECADIPSSPFTGELESSRDFFRSLGKFLQTLKGTWRAEKGLRSTEGFPATPRGRAGKARFSALTAALSGIQGLEPALAAIDSLPPARYPEEDWQIVRACFTLLRHAAAELRVVFAEAGTVDFVEVAQIARRVLADADERPTDAALAISDGIRHLLVDEFQDTSRRQHRLLASLVAAWPERAGRTCFAVGDPMQSIYFFRDADAELFQRVKTVGLEISDPDFLSPEPLLFDFVPLRANFRTVPSLVDRLNQIFVDVFTANDREDVVFSAAEPARQQPPALRPSFKLHLNFAMQILPFSAVTRPPKNSVTIPAEHPAENHNHVAAAEKPNLVTWPEELNPVHPPENLGLVDRAEKFHPAKGKGFSPYMSGLESSGPSQAAEILGMEGGGGFNPRIKPAESAGFSPGRTVLRDLFQRIKPFSAASSAPEGLLSEHLSQNDDPQTTEIIDLIRSHIARIDLARVEGGKYRVAVLARTRNSLVPIAEALHQAAIPFRAIDLEKLAARPEVLDALALAHALFNPHDRVAWLGILRAPWCGLSLSDLHRLASDDNPELLARPIPDLLAERLPLLIPEGRIAVGRVLGVINSVTALRATQPTSSVGTWLEKVWLRLGGADCVDTTARANLDLLWSCLDHLPGGEQDLQSLALDAALDQLTALPDPQSDTNCGVQLMTIHKSKGLEFEVVIVPNLEAGCGRGGRKMLSWLERGLVNSDDPGEITEFLIAPLQSKGADRGKAKEWVDRVCRDRETQEDKRILYVAATRAREELHLFANPVSKVDSNGELTLPDPAPSLLATAWPALGAEVRTRFEEWKAELDKQPKPVSQPEPADIASIAASAQGNLLLMPAPPKPTFLRRLPQSYRLPETPEIDPLTVGSPTTQGAPSFPRPHAERVGDHKSNPASSESLYARHQGGLLTRALGTAVHAFLEALAQLRKNSDWSAAREALTRLEPRVAAHIRATGLEPSQAASIAAEALRQALSASRDPAGEWILSPHAEASTEASWTGIVAGSLHTIRIDRVFSAGLTPFSEGEDCWWIVDYKTAHPDTLNSQASLPALRLQFAPQIEAYAAVLRNLPNGDKPIRAGLYYPRMLLFDWWEL
jgi:ATP-dependent exoDNAse (exonuclease V) beta subunit